MAFQESYWRFHDAAYDRYWGFAWQALGCSHADADDAADAAFAGIGKEWLRMQSMKNPAGFAWRILKNRIEDVRRKRKKQPVPMDPMDLTAFEPDPDDSAEDPYHQLTQRIVVHEAMRHLTERQRDVLNMTTRLEYTDQETAAIMGVTPNTVRTTRSQATQKLTRLLASATDHPDGRTS